MFYTAYERLHEAAFDRQQDSCGQDERVRKTNIALPLPPCKWPTCGRRGPHGICDSSEPLELVTIPYSVFIKANPKQKAEPIMELLPKPRTDNDASSLFFRWSNIGDTIIGKFINYEKEAGQFKKPEITLKTKDGKKLVSAPKDLQDRIEGPAEAGDLDGKWLRIAFVAEKEIKGRDNKMKQFKVECFESEAQAQGAATSSREPGDDSDDEDIIAAQDRKAGLR